MDSVHDCHVQNGRKLGTMTEGLESRAKISMGILKGFWKDLGNGSEHFPPLKESRGNWTQELLVKHQEP